MRTLSILLLLGLILSAWAGQPVPPAQAEAGRFVCRDPAVRAQIETVYDRHRAALRDTRNRLSDERYAFRRLLLSPQATREQLEAQGARLREAQAAFQRAWLRFLVDLRESVPVDRREQVLRCALGLGWRLLW